MENKELITFEKAQKKVAAIKAFYNHLLAYVIVNLFLFAARDKLTFVLISKEAFGDPNFMNWLDWNFYGTPIVWGIGLIIQAVYTFGVNPFFGKRWEERQIQKFINEDHGKF